VSGSGVDGDTIGIDTQLGSVLAQISEQC
jgi:hypothetical protein